MGGGGGGRERGGGYIFGGGWEGIGASTLLLSKGTVVNSGYTSLFTRR